MVQVSKAAGTTTGALTFHFGTKDELADAVQVHGCAAVRAVVDRVRADGAPALDLVVELTVHLARLLEDNAAVRSSARLARERPGAVPGWSASWLPTVRELAYRAQRTGQLRAGTPPAVVSTLAVYLLVGTEVRTRAALEAARQPEAAEQLQQLWETVLNGICADRGA
jgi:AcrR family transcriptional regulator